MQRESVSPPTAVVRWEVMQMPRRASQATITIKRPTYEKLEKLKAALGFLTWDELVESLIKCVEEKVKK
jgi:hypothetical protein